MPEAFDTDRFVELLQLSLIRGLDRSGNRVQQQELAERLGIHPQTVSRWIRGQNRPSEEWVERLRRVFAWTDEDVASLYPSAASADAKDADEIYTSWAEAVGLGSNFPLLPADPGASRDDFDSSTRDPFDEFVTSSNGRLGEVSEIHSACLAEIYQSMSSLLWVTVAPGHGGSAIARILQDLANGQSLVRRSIPVFLSLTEVLGNVTPADLGVKATQTLTAAHPRLGVAWNVDVEWVREVADDAAQGEFGAVSAREVRRHVEQVTWEAVVLSLASHRWDRVVGSLMMADVLGIDRSTLAAGNLREAMERQQLQLRAAAEQLATDPVAVKQTSRWLARAKIAELIEKLRSRSYIRLQFVVDLTPAGAGRLYTGELDGEYLTTAYRNAALNFFEGLQRFVRSLEARGLPGAVSILVVAPRGLETPDADGDWDAVAVPPFRSVDVARILNYWYSSADRSENGQHRGMINDLVAEYLDLPPNMAISTALLLMRRRLRDALASDSLLARHRGHVPPLKPGKDAPGNRLDIFLGDVLDCISLLSVDDQRRVLTRAINRLPAAARERLGSPSICLDP
jgi:transcriptional regulator with XRE-family HTH domain